MYSNSANIFAKLLPAISTCTNSNIHAYIIYISNSYIEFVTNFCTSFKLISAMWSNIHILLLDNRLNWLSQEQLVTLSGFLVSFLVLIYRRWSATSAMVGDDTRMIAGNKLFCFLRFDRRWSPTITDIIHRRSHISQTSRRRRKALIADHRYFTFSTCRMCCICVFLTYLKS